MCPRRGAGTNRPRRRAYMHHCRQRRRRRSIPARHAAHGAQRRKSVTTCPRAAIATSARTSRARATHRRDTPTMIGWHSMRMGAAVSTAAVLMLSGCAFNGVNSLPLPGTVGHGPGATIYHVEIANVGTLESNSPVMMNDVVVGSVGTMTLRGRHADVEVRLQAGQRPWPTSSTVGQTSLLGSTATWRLDPPPGQPPLGHIAPGSTIALNESSTYPSTEQTLSSLSAVVNGGGLGQVGDIVRNFNAALSGRRDAIRDLITLASTGSSVYLTINAAT